MTPEIPYARFYKSPDDQVVFETVEEAVSQHRHRKDELGCVCGWSANDFIAHVTHEVIQGLRKEGYSIVRNRPSE